MVKFQYIEKEHIITTSIMFLIAVIGFFATDQFMAMQIQKGKEFWNPAIRWDFVIPLSPGWIWIYLSFFPLCFLPITWKEVWCDKITFRRTILGLAILYGSSFALFWIFSTQMIRPVITGEGINEIALRMVYEIDPGFNIFPSIHIANMAYIACVAWGIKRRFISTFLWIFCLLIAVSTLYVKQHYILDLPSGLILGAASYFLAFSRMAYNPVSKVI